MFTKPQIKQWRRAIHKELRWWNMPSDDPTYRAGMVLATVYGFGTDVGVLATLSGQSEAFVRMVLKRARASRMLVGQTLRVAWNRKDSGLLALGLDAMVAEGTVTRPPDPVRSAAAKGRKRSATRKPRAPRTKTAPGAVFTPKVQDADPLYGLSKWEKK